MLNPKQERFCLEYVSSSNATDAYRKAYGVTDETTAATCSSKLLRTAKVKDRLKELASEMASRKIAQSIELQEKLTAIIRDKVTEEVILQNGDRVQRRVAVRDILKAIEILLKVQGAFVTQIKFDTTPIVISGGDQLED